MNYMDNYCRSNSNALWCSFVKGHMLGLQSCTPVINDKGLPCNNRSRLGKQKVVCCFHLQGCNVSIYMGRGIDLLPPAPTASGHTKNPVTQDATSINTISIGILVVLWLHSVAELTKLLTMLATTLSAIGLSVHVLVRHDLSCYTFHPCSIHKANSRHWNGKWWFLFFHWIFWQNCFHVLTAFLSPCQLHQVILPSLLQTNRVCG